MLNFTSIIKVACIFPEIRSKEILTRNKKKHKLLGNIDMRKASNMHARITRKIEIVFWNYWKSASFLVIWIFVTFFLLFLKWNSVLFYSVPFNYHQFQPSTSLCNVICSNILSHILISHFNYLLLKIHELSFFLWENIYKKLKKLKKLGNAVIFTIHGWRIFNFKSTKVNKFQFIPSKSNYFIKII